MIDTRLNIFIASASEGLDVANAVRDALGSNIGFQPRIWNEGTFKPSVTFIEALEEELAQSDFAVLTLTPDDQTESRGKVSMAPRDNVLFELGLFMGRLGRNRTYFVCDKNQELKIPTDLLGVKPVTYEMGRGQKLKDSIAVACSPIAKRMREFRPKQSLQTENESRLIIKFCERIAGTWWGRQRGTR
jgi:CRP/FNR family cyclic AMP-dependent transcriptional regulator